MFRSGEYLTKHNENDLSLSDVWWL